MIIAIIAMKKNLSLLETRRFWELVSNGCCCCLSVGFSIVLENTSPLFHCVLPLPGKLSLSWIWSGLAFDKNLKLEKHYTSRLLNTAWCPSDTVFVGIFEKLKKMI